MTVRAAAITLMVGLSTLAACGGTSEPPPAAERVAESNQPPCSQEWVEANVSAFLLAASQGDAAALEEVIADESAFRVFSHTLSYGPTPTRFVSTENRDRLIPHLLERQAKGDRMRLRSLRAHDFDRAFQICNFGFEIERRIGHGPLATFIGKGALDQPTGAIAVWNTGGEVER